MDLDMPSISGICRSMSAQRWLTSISLPSSSLVLRDCSIDLKFKFLPVLLTNRIFLAMTCLFLAVLNLSRMSPLTSGVPAILGSMTKLFPRSVDGGSAPVVMYFKHSMMVWVNACGTVLPQPFLPWMRVIGWRKLIFWRTVGS